MSDRVLKAPYDGDCIVCDKPYFEKDSVAYKAGRLVHKACEDAPTEDVPTDSRCPDCGVEIVWVYVQGRTIPLNAEPGGEGARYRKERVDETGRKVVQCLTYEELAENTRPVYSAHVSTCAKAESQ